MEAQNETATQEKPFVVPDGFSYTRETTAVGKTEYAIEYLTADSLDAWFALWQGQGLNPQDTALKYINEIQTQRAVQGGKGAVRDAVDEKDDSGNVVRTADDVRAEAVGKHQKAARKFLLGKPRTRSVGGLTQKKQQEIGAAVTEFVMSGGIVTPEKYAEIAMGLGIDPSLLNLPKA